MPEMFIVFEGNSGPTPGFCFVDVVRDAERFEKLRVKSESMSEFDLFS